MAKIIHFWWIIATNKRPLKIIYLSTLARVLIGHGMNTVPEIKWHSYSCITLEYSTHPTVLGLELGLQLRLTLVFLSLSFVACLPKRGGYQPPVNLKLTRPFSCLVLQYSVGLLFPLIPKSWKSVNVWRHNDVIKHGQPENADFQQDRNKVQNWFFFLQEDQGKG